MTTPTSAYDRARHHFHTLRGHLNMTMQLAALLHDLDSDNLTQQQRDFIERLVTAAQAFTGDLELAAKDILDALGTPPTAGILWESACVVHDQIDSPKLERRLAIIKQTQSLTGPLRVIAVAPEPPLRAIRQFFVERGDSVRMATAPVDIAPLLATEPADMLAVAPPVEEKALWWRVTYHILNDVSLTEQPRPVLLHLWNAET